MTFSSVGSASAAILWSADHETGNLSQYTAGNTYGGSFDSDCIRPTNGVATDIVHSGNYSMKLSAQISGGTPGCRQFRYEESTEGHSTSSHTRKNPLYYSFWMYMPERYQIVDWSNIIQFKSKTYNGSTNEAFWVLELRNRSNGNPYFAIRYKGLYPGPQQGNSASLKMYHQTTADFPVREWVFMEIYLSQSTNPSGQQSNYDGQLIVKQNGVEIFNMNNIATRYPDAWDEWSLNTYTMTNGATLNGTPVNLTMYYDDVTISTTPVGSSVTNTPIPTVTFTSTPTPTRTPTPTPSITQVSPTATPLAGSFNRVHVEAEAAAPLSPMQVNSADGVTYVSSNTSNSGQVTLPFSIPQTGTYTVWARVYAPTITNNSFYVTLDNGLSTSKDGQGEDTFDIDEAIVKPEWQWVRVTGRGGTTTQLAINPRQWDLAAGEHTITFRQRDSQTRLDKIMITNDPSSIFSETNPQPSPTGSLFCKEDINEDGIVDLTDYSILVADFFQAITSRSDINGDGIVDLTDYSLLVARFFTSGSC